MKLWLVAFVLFGALACAADAASAQEADAPSGAVGSAVKPSTKLPTADDQLAPSEDPQPSSPAGPAGPPAAGSAKPEEPGSAPDAAQAPSDDSAPADADQAPSSEDSTEDSQPDQDTAPADSGEDAGQTEASPDAGDDAAAAPQPDQDLGSAPADGGGVIAAPGLPKGPTPPDYGAGRGPAHAHGAAAGAPDQTESARSAESQPPSAGRPNDGSAGSDGTAAPSASPVVAPDVGHHMPPREGSPAEPNPPPGADAATPPADTSAGADKGTEAKAGPNLNPFSTLTLDALAATRGAPLFTPSRKPPEVAAEAPPPPPAEPEPPAPPEPPQLQLIGVVMTNSQQVALLSDPAGGEVHRLKPGEDYQGWTVKIIDPRTVELENGDQKQTLTMFSDFKKATDSADGSGSAAQSPSSDLDETGDTQPEDNEGMARPRKRRLPHSAP
jgi:hypothetical protein